MRDVTIVRTDSILAFVDIIVFGIATFGHVRLAAFEGILPPAERIWRHLYLRWCNASHEFYIELERLAALIGSVGVSSLSRVSAWLSETRQYRYYASNGCL